MSRKSWFHREEPEIIDPAGLMDNVDDYEDNISVYDAAEIWRDSGKDEDNMFGYSEDELNDALNR